MLLPREFVTYLGRQLAGKLSAGTVEISNPAGVCETVTTIVMDELMVEDKLNDEVRSVLNQYQEHMRQTGVSYQEMFKLIKNKLVKERRLVL